MEPSGAVDSDEEKDLVMASLARYRPRPMATYTHVSTRHKYQYIRMKGMIHSALGAPPGGGGGSIFSGMGSGADNTNTPRGLALGMFGVGGLGSTPMSATAEQFPQSAGHDSNAGSRRPSVMGPGSAGGPRQILPGQLPGPGAQARKSSMASAGAS
jgi:SAGA-associated factor 73